MKKLTAFLILLPVSLFLLADRGEATGTGGTNFPTISSNSTNAQTLSSGTGTVNSSITLNVGSGGNSPSGNGTPAITVTGNSSIVNNGTIEELDTAASSMQNGRAIYLNTKNVTLTITNNLGALIETGDADPIQVNKGSDIVTMYNYGTVTSLNASNGGAQAIDWNAISSGSNALFNYATGVLQANEADAVRPGVNGFVYNDGLIKSTNNPGSTDGSDGIDAQTNTGITIVNADTTALTNFANPLSNTITNSASNPNLIEGARHGITGGADTSGAPTGVFAMTVINYSNGAIQGDDGSGINIDGINGVGTLNKNELVTVYNAGKIYGDGVTGDGDGVDIDGLVNITNTGTIQSKDAFGDTSEGITVGGGTITNSGTIEGSVTSASAGTGSVGRGITIAGVDKDANDNAIALQPMYGATVITNNSGGLIKGDTDSGIAVLGGASGFTTTITNNANATIEGGGGAVAVIRTDANSVTINNSGVIKAINPADGTPNPTGNAIDLGAGTGNSLNISGGSASIIGNISGSAGAASALTIDPGASNSFSYAGVISNFSSVEIKSGTVDFSGDNIYDGTTTIDGSATLDLTGSGTIGSTTTLTIASGGIFDLGGATITVGALQNSGTINNGTVLTSSAGSVSGLSGSTGLTQSNGGTTTVTGTNTYSGTTTVTGGTLNVSGTITQSTTTVSGGGDLHLSEGTLANVILNSGGSLTGNGTVGGLSINSGATLSPGNSPGVINAATTVFNPGGSFILQVDTDGRTGTAGVNWDQLAITGKLDVSNLSPSLTFALNLQTLDSSNVANPLASFDPTVNHTWVDVITTTGGFTGTFNSADFTFNTMEFQNALQIGHFSLVPDALNADDLDLRFSAAPEPGTWALLIGGFSLLAYLRIKRRKLTAAAN